MENKIVIINSGDIQPAVQVAKNLDSYSVYLFDPVLMDQVAASGLKNVELISWDNCPPYTQLDSEAHAEAFALEAELDSAIRNIVPDVSIAAWQHLNLYYLLMAIKWYSGLWNELGHRLCGTKAHIFICDTPATYYFNSFTPAVLLLGYLKGNDIEFSGYTYKSTDVAYLVPDLSGTDTSEGAERILTHLPTCFYDINYFNQEISASGKTVINIEAKHFNVPVFSHATLPLINGNNALSNLTEPLRETINAVALIIEESLERYFTLTIPFQSYRERQVQHLCKLYCYQLLTYFQLNAYFERSKLSKILLSDHDAGFHGPIISFAHKHLLPVLLLPHSKNSNDIQFSYTKISALTHPAQGKEIFNSSGKSVLNEHLLYPEAWVSSNFVSAGVRTISLLLNSQSLNGIYFSHWDAYIEGIRRIVKWCEDTGIKLKVRCNPGYSILLLLSKETGLDLSAMSANMTEPIEQHALSCDLCLMYDQPTSGALYFLKNSIPILNPVIRPLASNEMALGNPFIIPRDNLESILRRITGYTSDPISLTAFRNNQFRNYVQLFQNARPLRSYL